MAELLPGTLLMNGRSAHFSWKLNRTNYISKDNGATWGKPFASVLQDDGDSGSEAALISVVEEEGKMPTVYFSEPRKKHRMNLTLRCSHDGGHKWPENLSVDGDTRSGYSALLKLVKDDTNAHHILVVWEDDPNMLAEIVEIRWCDQANY